MADFRLIRDVLTIDKKLQDFYNSFDGAGPVFLLGRMVQHGLVSCVLEHGSRYEQTAPDGTLDVQILEARTTTVMAPVTPLVLDGVHLGEDAPLDSPQALSYWGRGVGGDWVLRMPSQQPGGELVNLDELSMVQVWIDYSLCGRG